MMLHRPKPWGFNGTERPGARFLIVGLATHYLKGRSAFSIYGRSVHTAEYTKITPGIKEKLLGFTHAGPPAAIMRSKSALALAEGWTFDLPAKVYEILNERTDPTWPTHWFGPLLTGEEPWTDIRSYPIWVQTTYAWLWLYWVRIDYACICFAYSCLHAQYPESEHFLSVCLECFWNQRTAMGTFSSLCKSWAALSQVLSKMDQFSTF